MFAAFSWSEELLSQGQLLEIFNSRKDAWELRDLITFIQSDFVFVRVGALELDDFVIVNPPNALTKTLVFFRVSFVSLVSFLRLRVA